MATRDLIFAAAGAAGGATYVEDVFSTYLYTGNGSTQTITNGIEITGEGALVWIKDRSGVNSHVLVDTARGATNFLRSNSTNAQVTDSARVSAFTSSGFSVGNDTETNGSGSNYASWTFRKAEKFFDVVTYTGNGSNRTISHNLGSVPGMIIIKKTSLAEDWVVYHRSLGGTKALFLNQTFSADTLQAYFNNTNPTSTVFTVGDAGTVNESGETYVAYLFAHDAGGFGTAGTDNVISCGSYTGNGSATGPVINLGYEPQWLLFKNASGTGDWQMFDTMRGIPVSGNDAVLFPNTSDLETISSNVVDPTATGFQIRTTSSRVNTNGSTYIYMAIRRPMKTPTSGIQVFSPNIETTTTDPQTLTTGFPVDLTINTLRGIQSRYFNDRLRGSSTTRMNDLISNNTSAESSSTGVGIGLDNNTGIVDSSWWNNTNAVFWNFRRATGFFDVVCYTGTGSLTGVTHNLGVTPELKIIKRRNSTADWIVGGSILGEDSRLFLNLTDAVATSSNYWDGGNDSSTVFSVRNTNNASDSSGGTYVAYLFATVAGVSKVGSYTGTGSTQTINAGLPTGARFVLIKRTDSTGNWWVWDTARGMVTSTDPRLALNSTAAEINNNWVYTVTNGFQIVTTDATVNASGGSYIYLAIA